MRICITVTMLLLTMSAEATAPPAPVQKLLKNYERAWTSLNPFFLVDLAAPQTRPFDALLSQPRFDALKTTSILIKNVEIITSSDNRTEVAFDKDQEDVFKDGTVTHGIARVRLGLRKVEQGPPGAITKVWRIATHTTVPYDLKATRPQLSKAESHFFESIQLIQRNLFPAALAQLDLALEARQSLVLRTGNHRFVAQVHYFRATCLIKIGEDKAAAGALKTATELNPEFPLALNQLAEAKLRQGDLMGGLDVLRQSLFVLPEQPETSELLDFVGRALTHMRTDEHRYAYLSLRGEPPRKALLTARKYMLRDPANQEWRRLVASLLLETNQPEDVEQLLNREPAIRDEPSFMYLWARAAVLSGKPFEALKRFDQLWNKSPDYRDSAIYLTELNAQAQRWRAAVSTLKKAVIKRPTEGDLHYKLGVYTLRLGRRFEALTHLQKARSLKPSSNIRPALHKLIQQL